jgi:hypothetical protein
VEVVAAAGRGKRGGAGGDGWRGKVCSLAGAGANRCLKYTLCGGHKPVPAGKRTLERRPLFSIAIASRPRAPDAG